MTAVGQKLPFLVHIFEKEIGNKPDIRQKHKGQDCSSWCGAVHVWRQLEHSQASVNS